MHDGVSYEQHGKPAVVICTEPFVATARAIASVLRVPGYPFAVVPHPIGSLGPEEIRERAREAWRQGVVILREGKLGRAS